MKKDTIKTCACGEPVNQEEIDKCFRNPQAQIAFFEQYAEERLDHHFPKSKNKKRGRALIYHSELMLYVQNLIRTLY